MNSVNKKKSAPQKTQKPKAGAFKMPQPQRPKAEVLINQRRRAITVTKSSKSPEISEKLYGDENTYQQIFNGQTERSETLPKKSTSSVLVPPEDVKEWEEYRVYKKLKAEMQEFYQYPSLWLEAPHDLLGGRTPLEVALASPEGNEFILDMIQSIKAGYFS